MNNTTPKLWCRTEKLYQALLNCPEADKAKTQEEITNLISLCRELSPSNRPRYHRLNEWYDEVRPHIRSMLASHGFINGDKQGNENKPLVQVWLAVSRLLSSITSCPHLDTQVSRHHASAHERNITFIGELTKVITHFTTKEPENMGSFDLFHADCPDCNKTNTFQTKAGRCEAEDYTVQNAPLSVLASIVETMPSTGYECEHCGNKFTVSVQFCAQTKSKQEQNELWQEA